MTHVTVDLDGERMADVSSGFIALLESSDGQGTATGPGGFLRISGLGTSSGGAGLDIEGGNAWPGTDTNGAAKYSNSNEQLQFGGTLTVTCFGDPGDYIVGSFDGTTVGGAAHSIHVELVVPREGDCDHCI